MVIHTYSVIISNSKTMEAFSRYQPLFSDALNSDRIGVCKWSESGTTIDSALPELRNLTDDKEEWRAVIVRYIDDNCMDAWEYMPYNPYDFLINSKDGEDIKENEIPLVRLTQLLGGIPAPEVKFKAEIIKEEHKAPRTVYTPIIDKERERKYQSLARKYRFDGKAPSSIIMVSIRKNHHIDETIASTELFHKESESSEFWKRNQYPSICRFVVYDIKEQGPIQKEADDFNFWLSILLLSINDIDPAALQAYRLYRIKTVMQKEQMKESFQEIADRLRDAKNSINKEIKQDIENQICEIKPVPDYRINIPVVVKLPSIFEMEVQEKSFRFLPKDINSDLASWKRQREEIEEDMVNSVRMVERVLDQTADKMRDNCSFNEEEVEQLNKYQEEDMNREINGLYHNIVSLQGILPKDNLASNPEMEEITKEVKKCLITRVLRDQAVFVYTFVFLLFFAAMIPSAAQILKGEKTNYISWILVFASGIVFSGLVALLNLFGQKMKLNKLIQTYNQYIKTAFVKFTENTDDYVDYMSSIASHARGASYISLSARKKHYKNEEHFSRYKHLKAINILLSKMKAWSEAYHLDIDFVSKRPEARMEVDTLLTPIENKLYSFDSGRSYPIGLNNSGMNIESPFAFANKLEIIREELYDDAKRD